MSISFWSDCKLLLYADDSTILFSHKDPEMICQKLWKEIESGSNDLVDNKLYLHLGNTECTFFCIKRKLDNNNNNNNILYLNRMTYLVRN